MDKPINNKIGRDILGEKLVELGKQNDSIVVLDAGVSGSTKTNYFAHEFPDRFYNVGICEQNMITTAAGLASFNKIPFICAYAIFGIGRAWEQIRNTLSRCDFNVKIIVTHAGITAGRDGSSHQSLEDISIMRPIPNFILISPSDTQQIKWSIDSCIEHSGPMCIRIGRGSYPTIYKSDKIFKIGKGVIIRDGYDATIIASGTMVLLSIKASEILSKKGFNVSIIDMHTIKPLDINIIIEYAKTYIPHFI